MTEAGHWEFRILPRHFDPGDWTAVLSAMLPGQGSIELQNDGPGKEFSWHAHETDETLAILDGALRFYWEGAETVCRPGDVICLPRGMRHGSVAMESGARYAIAMHRAFP